MLIDTHAHIYLPEFDADRAALIERAQKGGIYKILMPAVDTTTHASMLQAEKDFDSCMAMMGVHPCSVGEGYKEELQVAADYLQQRTFIAVGETGLDFYWDKTFISQQYEAFHQQIAYALHYQLPVVIHSRNATDECIAVVKQYPALKGVFHCFSGSAEQAMQLIELNFMLGIGGVVTFKNAGLNKVIQQTGMGQVILETDAPYLAPVPYRGKRNESSYLPLVAQKIAEATGGSTEEVAAITTQNATKLFGLP